MIDPKENEKKKNGRIEPRGGLSPSEILEFRKMLSAVSPLAVSESFPSGIICMWSGSIGNIPGGWQLCNGENGSPDLRSKFIKGAAPGQGGGAIGGSLNHTHGTHTALSHSGMAVASHGTLTHSGSAVGDHATQSHSGTAIGAHDIVQVQEGVADTNVAGTAGHSVTQPTTHPVLSHGVTQPTSHGTLTHGVTEPNDHSISGHNSVSNEPEWYAMLFIQKT